MMKLIYGFIAALLSAIVVFNPVHASLVSVDWKNAGDNLLTRDTDSKLDWLDLTETRNMSYVDVISLLGPGGLFEGFSYASNAQVVALWQNYGIDLAAGAPVASGVPLDPAITTASQQLGNILPQLAPRYEFGTLGLTGEGSVNTMRYVMGAYVDNGGPVNLYVPSGADEIDVSTQTAYYGSFLVTASPVPVPPALWLFASGLAGLIGLARKKTAACLKTAWGVI